jgi:isopenicillin N synthase-like dioxygenase
MKKQSRVSQSFVTVPYPKSLEDTVAKAVASWKSFCILPEATKKQFSYHSNNSTASGKNHMGVGYELKKTAGSFLDQKEDFHFTTGEEKWLQNETDKIKNKEALNLVEISKNLVTEMSPFILDYARSLEKDFGLTGLEQEVRESKDHWFLRYLHYFGERKVGEEIATSHADKSGFTLHLYESDPGLEMLTMDMNWVPMPVGNGNTVIIPGMRLQYRSKNKLKALFHRVLATKDTAKTGRFSMVCFVHLMKTPQYDKAKAGRLQEFPPGFNYDMPFEEFAKLFTHTSKPQ